VTDRRREAPLSRITLVPHTVPRRVMDPIVRAVARTGLSPNGVTLLGFAGNVLAAGLVAGGLLPLAGVVMLVAGGLDLIDGALARATGRAGAFGAVFDAVLDRCSEAAVLLGLVVYFGDREAYVQVALLFAALTGSVLVSYVRARAETLGLSLREGLFTRAERVLLTAAALVAAAWWPAALTAALWVLAVVTTLTVLQRLYHVWQKTRTEPAGSGRGESEAGP
jgi:CDP-diacylglycerol--glycerol-3-phosphate 3-phosphatidyltransferase